LSEAQVVVHDRLSAIELLSMAPAHAELIDVGKAPDHHRMTQDRINELLVERGLAGQNVVRLKGGDPFVFARGSEEAAALEEAGVSYEVVPGITSALAVPAYGGIPVTQRFSSTSFTVVTGHEDPASGEGTVDWDAIAHTGGTLVILMGVHRWPAIAQRLLASGLSPDTPAAAVRWGTRPNQSAVRATLATLADQPLKSPSVIVVGTVAGEHLDWFTSRPLFSKKIVVTRARAQSSTLVERLRALGADVVEAPMIAIADPPDGGASLVSALENLADFEWLVFTSANAVHRFFVHVADARRLAGLKVAAVGPATASALAQYRVLADLEAKEFGAEGLVDSFPQAPSASPPLGPPPSLSSSSSPRPVGEPRALWVRGLQARSILAEGLEAKGWIVSEAVVYQNEVVQPDEAALEAIEQADAICFTASSTVTNFCDVVGSDRVPPVVVSIGPQTSETARSLGVNVDVQADPHSIDGVVQATLGALVDVKND